ncbi:hypothetical protein B6N60_02484 [Richelia sinica FACHB-800]|uniref:Uncharacterized protein n=1 Tax=Richelia sinica FACHB-800 TaxID=1357546 RepID=A0A975T7T3_9NOST|nr:hypothetical protein [Richelia sinica]MBD2666443.1 hypothetical protein [Richelia sinica FACHB-800]QXE23793.1 hypothetical protein B6N60_02484 [Richelia sinica FACHB-800]
MPLFFLITLGTGLATTYLFKKSHDEIGYIAGIMTGIGFIISLIIAPWQIQVLMLLLVLFSSKKF